MEIALRLCEILLKDGQRKGRKMELRLWDIKVLIGNGNLMKALRRRVASPSKTQNLQKFDLCHLSKHYSDSP